MYKRQVLPHEEGVNPCDLTQVPDGRVLMGTSNAYTRMLEGLPPSLMGAKPAAKPPKKKSKRALAGGASGSSGSSDGCASSSSSGPALKRGRSGAGLGSAVESDGCNRSSEDEGAAAEAEPLV